MRWLRLQHLLGRLGGRGAGAGHLEGVCLQMDSERARMRGTQALRPPLLPGHRSQDKEAAGHRTPHAAPPRGCSCWGQRGGGWVDGGTCGSRCSGWGMARGALGKASLSPRLALTPYLERLGEPSGPQTLSHQTFSGRKLGHGLDKGGVHFQVLGCRKGLMKRQP